MLKGEVSEVLVEGQQDPLFVHGSFEDVAIFAAGSVCPNP